MNGKVLARGLGAFGIVLGLAEFLAPRRTAELSGLQRRGGLLRLFGLREIGSGVLLLMARDPQKLLWVRVLGDLLDGAVLGEGMTRPDARSRERALISTLAVAPVVALDIALWLDACAPGRRWADQLFRR